MALLTRVNTGQAPGARAPSTQALVRCSSWQLWPPAPSGPPAATAAVVQRSSSSCIPWCTSSLSCGAAGRPALSRSPPPRWHLARHPRTSPHRWAGRERTPPAHVRCGGAAAAGQSGPCVGAHAESRSLGCSTRLCHPLLVAAECVCPTTHHSRCVGGEEEGALQGAGAQSQLVQPRLLAQRGSYAELVALHKEVVACRGRGGEAGVGSLRGGGVGHASRCRGRLGALGLPHHETSHCCRQPGGTGGGGRG